MSQICILVVEEINQYFPVASSPHTKKNSLASSHADSMCVKWYEHGFIFVNFSPHRRQFWGVSERWANLLQAEDGRVSW